MAKLVAKHSKGARRITEAAGGLRRGKPLDEIGTQGFVLAMEGVDGLEEKTGLLEVRCYLFSITYTHIIIIAYFSLCAIYRVW
jgi:hypothetical protein